MVKFPEIVKVAPEVTRIELLLVIVKLPEFLSCETTTS
jgi:hypothetical protein